MSKTLSKPATVKADLNGLGTNGTTKKTERVPVMKTYKIFIGGKFPRTESGRYYQPKGAALMYEAKSAVGARFSIRTADAATGLLDPTAPKRQNSRARRRRNQAALMPRTPDAPDQSRPGQGEGQVNR